MNTEALFSSKKDDWATPPDLFEELSEEFGGFDLDAAANSYNHKCSRYLSEATDALLSDWKDPTLPRASKVWLNPPYGRTVGKWVKKAFEQSLRGCLVVMLLPARTCTRYFHDWIWCEHEQKPRPGVEVRFIRGRLKFVGAESAAPFPSMIVVFHPRESVER